MNEWWRIRTSRSPPFHSLLSINLFIMSSNSKAKAKGNVPTLVEMAERQLIRSLLDPKKHSKERVAEIMHRTYPEVKRTDVLIAFVHAYWDEFFKGFEWNFHNCFWNNEIVDLSEYHEASEARRLVIAGKEFRKDIKKWVRFQFWEQWSMLTWWNLMEFWNIARLKYDLLGLLFTRLLFIQCSVEEYWKIHDSKWDCPWFS